jgi:hypothetical protein
MSRKLAPWKMPVAKRVGVGKEIDRSIYVSPLVLSD